MRYNRRLAHIWDRSWPKGGKFGGVREEGSRTEDGIGERKERPEVSFYLYNDDNRLGLEPLSQDRIRCYALAVSDDRQKAELRLLF